MAKVVLHGSEIARLFNDPAGPWGRWLVRAGTQVQLGARGQVGYGEGKDVSGPGIGSIGAHLRDTIVKRFVRTGNGLTLIVGSSHPIAVLHHEGTRPHVIRPTRAKVLRFPSGGTIIFAKVVRHPGTKPNRYLTDQLALLRA